MSEQGDPEFILSVIATANGEIAHLWNEDQLVPATEEEMRRGMKEAMAKFAHLLPGSDDCECVTCRSFRSWMRGK